MRVMCWFIKSHLEAAYLLQSSKTAAFLPYIASKDGEKTLKDVIIPTMNEVQQLAALPERPTKGLRHTIYSTVNKRVRSLEASGYLRKAAVKERTGGITNYYELRPKAHLATFLNSVSLEDLLDRVSNGVALAILATMIDAMESVLD